MWRSIAFHRLNETRLFALIREVNPYTLGLPESLVNRALVELKAVGLVEKDGRKDELSDLAKQLWIGAGITFPQSGNDTDGIEDIL